MTVPALIPLVGCACNLMLAVFVLLRGVRVPANRVYCCLTLCIAVWNIGQFVLFITADEHVAEPWARFLWMGVIFIPTLLIHFSLLIAQIPIPRLLWALYPSLALLALSATTDFFLTGVRKLGSSGWYAKPGPGICLATIPFCLMFASLLILIQKRKQLPPAHRSRLTPIIWSQWLLAILGTNDVLPIFVWDYYPFTKVPVYPYGSLAAVLFGLLLAYSVLQRHLLDVQIQISRIAAQLVRFLFLFVTGLALLLTAALLAPQGKFPVFAFVSALLVLVLTGIIATLFFPRLFGGDGMDKWERRLLGDHFEYQDEVRRFIANMTWYAELEPLMNDLHDLFTRTLLLRSYHVVLRDETTRAFSVFRAHPAGTTSPLPELKLASPIFRFFKRSKSDCLLLAHSAVRVRASLTERQAREQLASFNSELCFPLSFQDEPLGFLIFGSKMNADPFTATDIRLLSALVKTMALMVNQIRLKTQIQHTQELDLLGRMSRGMAHDLMNLITPISTLLQLSQETGDLDDELLPVALRNVDTMRAYIKEALFFSENLRPDVQLCRLDLLVHKAIEVATTSRPKDVRLTPRIPSDVHAELDGVLIQRLIANLITNAIDASEPGTEIVVLLERLAKTETERDWLRVRVVDEGEGISRENMSRVLMPYFTTKNRGDRERGFGLGLAICRKIAALHGGNLSIESQPGRGTMVQLDLPARQVIQTFPPPPIAASHAA